MAETSIPIFYRPEMSAKTESFSPSADKPRQFVEEAAKRYSNVLVTGDWEPVSRDDLYLVHDRDYVDAVLDLRADNGFGNRDPEVARSVLYTCGSIVSAVEFVACGGARYACSPTSGFHHAGWDFGGGFCTFNGLVLAAVLAIESGMARRVGILDCDFHFGNGTDDILDVFYDLKRRYNIRHWSSGQRFRRRGNNIRPFWNWLGHALSKMEHCDLIIYQAGADMHIDDPLGGLLDDSEMLLRDAVVKEWGVPTVFNLAGGYRRDENGSIWPVLRTHLATLEMFGAIPRSKDAAVVSDEDKGVRAGQSAHGVA